MNTAPSGPTERLLRVTGRLALDFKTIADFRKDNGPAIRAACRQFIALCRRLELFTHAVAAIDGSKFKAVKAADAGNAGLRGGRTLCSDPSNILSGDQSAPNFTPAVATDGAFSHSLDS